MRLQHMISCNEVACAPEVQSMKDRAEHAEKNLAGYPAGPHVAGFVVVMALMTYSVMVMLLKT